MLNFYELIPNEVAYGYMLQSVYKNLLQFILADYTGVFISSNSLHNNNLNNIQN